MPSTSDCCLLLDVGAGIALCRPEVTTAERSQLNAWILNSGVCDDTVDWGTVLADPNVPQTYNPVYFSDSIHPNAAGHAAMANATPVMRWFEAGAYP